MLLNNVNFFDQKFYSVYTARMLMTRWKCVLG